MSELPHRSAVPVAIDGPPAFHFVVPVWGEAYTRLFLATILPAHLAPGNLRGMKRLASSTYRIFTVRENVETVLAAPAVRALQQLLDVQIHEIDLQSDARYGKMSECYQTSVDLADEAGAAIFFLNADLLFADGSFVNVERYALAGKRVVETTGIRLLKQPVCEILRDRFTARPDGHVSIGSRELVRIALDHLHPISRHHLWSPAEEHDLLPSNLVWLIRDEGLYMRCHHLHPLMVYPRVRGARMQGTVDDDYVHLAVPDVGDAHVVVDSDEILFCELSDPSHWVGGGVRNGSVVALARWIRGVTHPRHRMLASHAIRLHTGSTDSRAWVAADAKASRLFGRLEIHLRGPSTPRERLVFAVSEGIESLRSAPLRLAQRWEAERRRGQSDGALVPRHVAARRVLARSLAPARRALHDWWGLHRSNAASATVWYKRRLWIRALLGPPFDVARILWRAAKRRAADRRP